MNVDATHHYREHPMGYACKDCGAAAHVGDGIRHTSRCDLAPRKWTHPRWPTSSQMVANDAEQTAGILGAEKRAEIMTGMRPPNHVTVIARAGQQPYIIQSFELGRWVTHPGQWVAIGDAKARALSASGVYGDATEFRVTSDTEIDRDLRVSNYIMRLKLHQLRTAGLVRVGDMLRAADEDELDQMWAPKSRIECRRRFLLAAKIESERQPRDHRPRVGLLRTLDLEFVGHDIWSIARVPKMRPWVALVRVRLSDMLSADGERRVLIQDRVFERGETDYQHSNKTGSRGVYSVFTLRQGHVYEVFDRALDEGPRRRLMIHDGQGWHHITPREAIDAQDHARR